LTTFLFGVVPIRSAGYDPSLDENHDGKIDGKDIALPALIFGTAGDPTVPVNVTNWPTNPPYQVQSVNLSCTFNQAVNVSDRYYYYNYTTTPVIYVGGYSRMWIYLAPPSPNETSKYTIANYGVTQYPVSIDWIDDPSSIFLVHENIYYTQSITGVNVSTLRSPPMWNYGISMNDSPIAIKSSYLRFTIYSYTAIGDDPGAMLMTVEIYLRNE
jgi:hypothetical protein